MKKVIVIVGQTATGKSDLAVRIAKVVGGEVISADSRQVYKGLDIGSGKIEEREMKGVPHHLLSIANPKKQFSVAEFKKLADKKIKEIIARDKVPIICGGTGFYVDAITTGIVLPEVPPNKALRENLNNKTAGALHLMLRKLDADRAETIDAKNKVRLIRAIEIVKHLGKVPSLKTQPPKYKFIKIGLELSEQTLKKKIMLRLRKRLRAGMAVEIFYLRKQGVSWKRFLELGFDQKFVALYLQKKINDKEMLESLFRGNWQYAKRQMTWFKRDKEIKWFNPKNYPKVKQFVLTSLK